MQPSAAYGKCLGRFRLFHIPDTPQEGHQVIGQFAVVYSQGVVVPEEADLQFLDGVS